MYSIVDIESTGGAYKGEKIIDIAVYNFDGKKITKVFSSLVNPGISIPAFISKLTGISNKMVEDAPSFSDIAGDVVSMTKGNIFVAHNVQYDYGIIRQEFKRLGYSFKRKKVCTVRFSEKVFPERDSYNLGTLCEDFGIQIHDRHRAAGDAQATVKLFKKLLKKDDGKVLENLLNHPFHITNFAPNVDIEMVKKIPDDTGVYYLFGEDNKVVYIGKSNNMRARVFQHLGEIPVNKDKRRMYHMVRDVKYELTGSELVALILESYEIKHHQPTFNKRQRNTNYAFGLYKSRDKRGYVNFKIKKRKAGDAPVAVFENTGIAKSVLDKWIVENRLCPKLSGRDLSQNACMQYQLKSKCQGACIGKEKVSRYNARVKKGIKRTFIYQKPDFLILSEGRSPQEVSAIAVRNNTFYGYAFFDEKTVKEKTTSELLEQIEGLNENPDADKIIRSYLKRNKLDEVIYF